MGADKRCFLLYVATVSWPLASTRRNLSCFTEQGTGSGGGKWASHFGEFSEEELSGFSETATGLKVKDIITGEGATPQSGQSVTAHYAGEFSCVLPLAF